MGDSSWQGQLANENKDDSRDFKDHNFVVPDDHLTFVAERLAGFAVVGMLHLLFVLRFSMQSGQFMN
jgi:hypothetical protein